MQCAAWRSELALPAPVRPQIPTSAAAGARAENESSASVSSVARYLWRVAHCGERESVVEWSTACAGGRVHALAADASGLAYLKHTASKTTSPSVGHEASTARAAVATSETVSGCGASDAYSVILSIEFSFASKFTAATHAADAPKGEGRVSH